MPSELHQLLVTALYRLLFAFVEPRQLGTVLFAAFPIKLWEGKLREPDVVVTHREHRERCRANDWLGADLVMGVISPDDRRRDTETKRREYAQAGIPEYWIIDPEGQSLLVLHLDAKRRTYREKGCFGPGDTATSPTLEGCGRALPAILSSRLMMGCLAADSAKSSAARQGSAKHEAGSPR